jgi:hypothetical protein
MDEVERIFLPISKSLALRVSGMGGYTSKCEKKSKSLHPTSAKVQETVITKHFRRQYNVKHFEKTCLRERFKKKKCSNKGTYFKVEIF